MPYFHAYWLGVLCASLVTAPVIRAADSLASQFVSPPAAARPWVYWYFMDGNLTREGMTADLEAMRTAGIGGAIFLEVDLGLPKGPVKFMSPEWRQLVAHAMREAERLGIEIVMGSGPGWCGTGGPWVQPDQSMQHLVASETRIEGPKHVDLVLPRPDPRTPFFGKGTLTPELAKAWAEYYRDVAVLAFPKPALERRLARIEEKALYQRAPYSSAPNVSSALPQSAAFPVWPAEACVPREGVLDLTGKLNADGRLSWDAPPGEWIVLRLGRTVTGQVTRPAPEPGLGLETDKFNPAAIEAHFAQFAGSLLKDLGGRPRGPGGWHTLHFDSWEMSSQNWSEHFRTEFQKRRGYDPLPFLPVYTGRAIGSVEWSERFLWDVRQTAQELTTTHHAARLRDLAHQHGLSFSMEPYDMNPNADLTIGAVADVPMAEFWWRGFNTSFSVIEAASIAHTGGRRIVAAEAFTSEPGEDWQGYPGNLKPLGDWAFAAGINRLAFHRYQHQPWLDRRPGMRMGPYGVHWERTQTWWPLVGAYHTYLARCQHLLRQGEAVADILFLAAEGSPHVFRAPPSATVGSPPDRQPYNFDGCSPETLMARASVRRGQIVFPGGTSYRLLVLPDLDTMTPALLRKLKQLARAGAMIVGPPPRKSPSLSHYPQCDQEVAQLAAELWSTNPDRAHPSVRWDASWSVPSRESGQPEHPLAGAHWIWYDEGNPAVAAPIGERWFTQTIQAPSLEQIQSAAAYVTADNEFTLILNGQEIAHGDNFHSVSAIDLQPRLRAGSNTITIQAINGGNAPNPAGLIARIELRPTSGPLQSWVTDASWRAAQSAGGEARPARDLGPLGMGPWGEPVLGEPGPLISVTYPPYDKLAQLLAQAGVAPDFESDGPLRYTHRAGKNLELYFVANRTERAVDARAVFRVAGRQPERWHPVTGQLDDCRDFSIRDGRTTIPLHFEPYESYFLVFRQPARPARPVPSHSRKTSVQELTGGWEVSFDPRWGGPARITFPRLTDWAQHTEEGIRHYSGLATYRHTFDWNTPQTAAPSLSTVLNLGTVRYLAQVRLNGQDLGVIWCAPWQVEVTRALRPGRNELEITVANLWINRLIGDVSLPAAQRLTWTSSNPFRADSKLTESGLLGPVTLRCDYGGSH